MYLLAHEYLFSESSRRIYEGLRHQYFIFVNRVVVTWTMDIILLYYSNYKLFYNPRVLYCNIFYHLTNFIIAKYSYKYYNSISGNSQISGQLVYTILRKVIRRLTFNFRSIHICVWCVISSTIIINIILILYIIKNNVIIIVIVTDRTP